LTSFLPAPIVAAVSIRITEECIDCGCCEDVCPVAAISEDAERGARVVDPERCTECVGLYGRIMCQVECPVEACVADPELVEAESDLLAKARRLMPEHAFGHPAPSHFR